MYDAAFNFTKNIFVTSS